MVEGWCWSDGGSHVESGEMEIEVEMRLVRVLFFGGCCCLLRENAVISNGRIWGLITSEKCSVWSHLENGREERSRS
jgi:hypothetical protein